MKYFIRIVLLICFFQSEFVYSTDIPSSARANKVLQKMDAPLKAELQAKNFSYGSEVFIRIFKTPGVLELWLKKDNEFSLFKRYSICNYSGNFGPKLKEGDYQAPEGFYTVQPKSLNPNSRFHLSFNLGYPNLFDQQNGRTGSALMVHGKCVSIGCYAMGDKNIEEIYSLMVMAFKKGQKNIQVNIFPFELEGANLDQFKRHKWYEFWKDLQPGYEYFNKHKKPPKVSVKNKRYLVE